MTSSSEGLTEMTDSSARTDTPAPAGRGPRWLTPRLSRWVAGVLTAVVVLAAAAVVTQLALVRPDLRAAEAAEDDRADAVRAAERFAVQVNNFDTSDVGSLKENLSPMLTTKFNADFEETVDGLLAEIEKADLSSQGEVIRSAVASADPDSAVVLVVADATATSVFGDRARHFRWTVDLVKVDGDWLVDNFTPVA